MRINLNVKYVEAFRMTVCNEVARKEFTNGNTPSVRRSWAATGCGNGKRNSDTHLRIHFLVIDI
jgi:hypothetical protein